MGMYEAVRSNEDRRVRDANASQIPSSDVESSLLDSSGSDGRKGDGGNSSKGRLVSLDVFRGLTVGVILLFPSPFFVSVFLHHPFSLLLWV